MPGESMQTGEGGWTFLDCPPSGLAMLTRLNPKDRTLWDNYDRIVADFTDNALDAISLIKHLKNCKLRSSEELLRRSLYTSGTSTFHPAYEGLTMFCKFTQGLADFCVTKAELRAVINEIISQRRGYIGVGKITHACI